MTTDDTTAAARAAAEDYARTPRMNVGTVRDRIAEAHLAGAEWQAAQETDGERAVRELHKRAWDGELDYCRRCVAGEGAIWPCATIQALDSARAARRDEEER